MRKICSLVVAFAMTFTMSCEVFAVSEPSIYNAENGLTVSGDVETMVTDSFSDGENSLFVGKDMTEDDFLEGDERFAEESAPICYLVEDDFTAGISLYSSEDYRKWAQGDPRWGKKTIGNSTVSSIGCVVTSIAKLIIQCELRDQSNFDVGTLVDSLNGIGAFTADGSLYWDKVQNVIPGFIWRGDQVDKNKTYSSASKSNNDMIINLIKAYNYHMVIEVGGHWVAVDEAKSLETGTVYIMNSYSSGQNADITLASIFPTYHRIVAYTGGTTPSSTASSEISISNENAPQTIWAGANFSVSGVINSGKTITNVTAGVYDVNNSLITGRSVNPGTYSYNISNLDSYIVFNKLTPGVYRYKVSATNSDKSVTLINKVFTVMANSETVANGTYVFKCAENTSYVMTVGGDNVQLNKYETIGEQAWFVSYAGDGFYTIRNYHTGYYLNVYNANTANSTNICIESGNNSTAQKWQILPAGNSFCLIPQCAINRCADITSGNVSNGANIIIYEPNLGTNQRFILDSSDCNFQSGHKITFDANGGSFPQASSTYYANGVNKDRGNGELIVYNVPNLTIKTNTYGNEALVNYNGKVIDYRTYGSSNQLTVPWGGFVLSGHLSGNSDGATFVDGIKIGDYVGYDYATRKVSVYKSIDGYLANHKYVGSGSEYGSLPTPTRSGYNFDGWYTAASGGTKITSVSSYSASKLYAHWTSNSVNVVKISSDNFPDPVFRSIISENFDTDRNGYLSESEIQSVQSLSMALFYDQGIGSIQGVEYFTEITSINCGHNNIEYLDLSKNTKLDSIICMNNKLKSLDISNCKKLTALWCANNQLTSLDLSNSPNLEFVLCSDNTFNIGNITSTYSFSELSKYGFVLSKTSNWKGAVCDRVNGLLKDFTSTTITYDYDCGNGITRTFTLIANSIPPAASIDIDTVSFPDSVFRTYVLNKIDVNGDKKLSQSEIDNTTSITLDSYITGGAKKLKGIEYFTSLIELDCSFNSITSLDLSKNTALEKLICASNDLTSLDVSQNTNLQYLDCMENNLTSIDVNNNTKLTYLDCNYNQLTYLTVINNKELTFLHCYNNKIGALDLSQNPKLSDLNVHTNQLVSLDLSNTSVKSVVASRNSIDIGTVSEFALSKLSRYGFKTSKASNWIGATYDSTSKSLINIEDKIITYDYDCGNGITVTFSLYRNPTSITDYESDVTITDENGFDSDVTVGVGMIDDDISAGSGFTTQAIYDITLKKDNIEYESKNKITISIPVPDGTNGLKLKIFRKEPNGDFTDMNAVYDSKTNTLRFTTNSLGIYVLAESESTGIPGDINNDDSFDIDDVIDLARSILTTTDPSKNPYLPDGDRDKSGKIDIDDVILLARQLIM